MSNELWLTYAWKDNEDDQIDYIIESLTSQGLDVSYDRARFINLLSPLRLKSKTDDWDLPGPRATALFSCYVI